MSSWGACLLQQLEEVGEVVAPHREGLLENVGDQESW